MPHLLPRSLPGRSLLFDVSAFAAGLAVLAWSLVELASTGFAVPPAALLAVPLIVVIARFPVVTDHGEGGIEVGFDSAVLLFLACTLEPWAAVALWSLGVLCTQLTSTRRRPLAVVFNVGVGITAGGIATLVLTVVAGSDVSGLRELLAVLLAAAAYFVTDFVLSGVSVALEVGTSVGASLVRPGSWLAVGCFVPFDLLGYLGAVISRVSPWWMLLLLAAPLATLLVATRAISHGRENARRLQVLLDAAVESQTLSESHQVVDSLVEGATRLLRVDGLVVRRRPPGAGEIGAQVRGGEEAMWIVAPSRTRARSTPHADEQALAALAAVSAAAFSRLALTEDLVHLARFDPLTDLPNRAVFLDRLNYALLQARRRDEGIALLFVDLDGFKPVNDRFGHAAGDAVLIDIARRLHGAVRHSDTVARLGGDEFAVLFEGIDADQVEIACGRVLAALAGGVRTGDHLVQVTASIGVALGSGQDHADEMLRNADLAMYEAKARGKNRYVIYEPLMLAARLERLELVEALGAAVDAGHITLAYQPVVQAATGRITGVEALARWSRDDVAVRPDLFIKVAEDTGLISALGAGVLDQVACDAPAIHAAAGGDINIAVNVSPSQLAEPGFVDLVGAAVDRMGGTGLILEITEREGIGEDPVVLQTMRAIKERGVSFAIDDFGVGFSSLSYLREVPASIVKIDATLSQNIDLDTQARGLLRSISMMSRSLGHDVVVEGVEREEQLQMVRLDVEGAYAQGFHLHRPMPLAQLLETLRTDRLRHDSVPVASLA